MRLLVVEDDRDLNRQIVSALETAGYAVDRALDGEEGQYLGETEPYDAVVLDLGLPKLDGASIITSWRSAGKTMPILVLTARDRWSDKVNAFDAGADDYVTKPFHLEELLARVRALLRRATGHATSELVCGPVRLDTRSGRVLVDGTAVKLTSHEYRLLSYLMHHRRADHLARRADRASLRPGFRSRFQHGRSLRRPYPAQAGMRFDPDRAWPRLYGDAARGETQMTGRVTTSR